MAQSQTHHRDCVIEVGVTLQGAGGVRSNNQLNPSKYGADNCQHHERADLKHSKVQQLQLEATPKMHRFVFHRLSLSFKFGRPQFPEGMLVLKVLRDTF